MMPFSFARQAIYNNDHDIKGYELFYRSSKFNRFPRVNGDHATMELLTNIAQANRSVTRGKPAFINYTRNLILKQIPLATPSRTTVVEILENVPAESEVIKQCQKLSEKGYTIALDDFTYRRELEPLILLADIIKIDFKKGPISMIKKEVRKLRHYRVKLLAEKVETREEAEIASKSGFDYFQGNFFSKAEMVTMQNFETIPDENLLLPQLSLLPN
jgi:c-di-GMP-related signal transduction protein